MSVRGTDIAATAQFGVRVVSLGNPNTVQVFQCTVVRLAACGMKFASNAVQRGWGKLWSGV